MFATLRLVASPKRKLMDFGWTLVFFAALFAMVIGVVTLMDHFARKAGKQRQV